MKKSQKGPVAARKSKSTATAVSASRNGVPKRVEPKSVKNKARESAQDARKPNRMNSASSEKRTRHAASPAGRLVGYARVSTDGQTTRTQIDALRAAGCDDVYTDDATSGTTTVRDGLDAALDALLQGDTLVVTRLDRLGRSLPHLVSTVHDLAARGVGFKSLAEAIDTTTATGRLVLGIFASLAAFERDLISERTTAALAAKKRRGEPVGRRRALTPAKLREARAMLDAGRGPSYVARMFGVGRSTLYRALGESA